jgi:TRAP-type uncharacterized transport system substrate-binding protein
VSISSPAFAQKKRISTGGARLREAFYLIAVGMAEIVNQFLVEYNAIALETGSLENIRLLGKGEIDIACANFRSHPIDQG